MQETEDYSLAIVKKNEDVAGNYILVLVDEETLKQKISSEKKEGDNYFYIETIEGDHQRGWVPLDHVKILPFKA